MYIAGFPRSGNTWFCYLMAYCLNTEYDDVDDPGVHPKDDYQRQFVKGGLNHRSYSGQVGRILKTHKHSSVMPSEDVIYLVRDPRDVMVSYWYYLNAGKDGDISIENNREKFSAFIRQHLPKWSEHVVEGLKLNPRIIVRYEDLLTLPNDALPGVFRLLNTDVKSDTIRHALEIFSFNNLSHRKQGEEQERAFFRKGIAGDWKDKLSEDDQKFILDAAGDIVRALGYEPEPVNREKPRMEYSRPALIEKTSKIDQPEEPTVNDGFLDRQREFWNVNNVQDAMFKRIVTDPEILKLSPEEQEQRWAKSIANSINRLLKDLPVENNWTILDIGCGIGRCVKPLRKMVARVDGVDIAETMVRMAREYLKDAPGEGRIITNNGKDLGGLSDGDYSFVYSMLVFQHIRSLSVVKSYLREIMRVLKPGGYFRVQVAEASMPKMGSFNDEADPDTQYGLFGNAYTFDQLRGLLHEHGFVDVDVVRERQWLWATGLKPLIEREEKHETRDTQPNGIDRPGDFSDIVTGDLDVERSLNTRTRDGYRVTALVSAYKSTRFLDGLFDDLTSQSLYQRGELEIVIVDSASPDDDWRMIEDFAKGHENVRAIRTRERETLYAAWNRGIREARGEFITNANTDDRHRRDAFELLSETLAETPYADLAYGNSYYSRTENETFDRNNHGQLFTTPVYFAPTLALHYAFGPHPLWRKSVHDRIGGFDGSYSAAGDWDFGIRFGMKCRAVHVPEAVGLYLWRDDAISYRDDTMKSENRRIFSQYHNPETVGALYASEGVSLETQEQEARVYLDMGVRAMQYIRPDGVVWRRAVFAQKCFEWAMNAAPGWIASHNNIALIMASQDNLKGAEAILAKLVEKTGDSIAKYNLSSIQRMVQTGMRDAPLKPMLSGLPFPPQTEFFHQSTNAKGATKALAEMV